MKKLEKLNLENIAGGNANPCGSYGILYGVGLALMLFPATAVVGIFAAGVGAAGSSMNNC
jgi:hypothetical protein